MARKEMMETLKVSKSQLSNITKNLVKKGIIMTESGRVYINPEFFWKGNLKVRDAIMNNSPISFDVKIDIA
jgi:polyhydroxyalkanoate synthesis regulator phasin